MTPRYRVLSGIPKDEVAGRRRHAGHLPFEPHGGGLWRSHLSRRRTGPSLDLHFDPSEAAGSLALLGVFALGAGELKDGTPGAKFRVLAGSRLLAEWELRVGDHLLDADDRSLRDSSPGDGSEARTVGCVEMEGRMVRLDLLSFELPSGAAPDRASLTPIRGGPQICVLEAAIGLRAPATCPFRAGAGGVALSDLSSIVRVRDRVRFGKALRQLEASMRASEDLDEARSEALTFVAVVTAGRLEAGAPRSLHRAQLDAARRFEATATLDELIAACRRILGEIAGDLMEAEGSSQDRQIDRALALLARNFTHSLSDEEVASEVGLSTSHFRHLFREVTGQPFRRYIVSLRLERAKAMLERDTHSVGDVATAVGFQNLAHFSRAFAQRFGASPTEMRKGRPAS